METPAARFPFGCVLASINSYDNVPVKVTVVDPSSNETIAHAIFQHCEYDGDDSFHLYGNPTAQRGNNILVASIVNKLESLHIVDHWSGRLETHKHVHCLPKLVIKSQSNAQGEKYLIFITYWPNPGWPGPERTILALPTIREISIEIALANKTMAEFPFVEIQSPKNWYDNVPVRITVVDPSTGETVTAATFQHYKRDGNNFNLYWNPTELADDVTCVAAIVNENEVLTIQEFWSDRIEEWGKKGHVRPKLNLSSATNAKGERYSILITYWSVFPCYSWAEKSFLALARPDTPIDNSLVEAANAMIKRVTESKGQEICTCKEFSLITDHDSTNCDSENVHVLGYKDITGVVGPKDVFLVTIKPSTTAIYENCECQNIIVPDGKKIILDGKTKVKGHVVLLDRHEHLTAEQVKQRWGSLSLHRQRVARRKKAKRMRCLKKKAKLVKKMTRKRACLSSNLFHYKCQDDARKAGKDYKTLLHIVKDQCAKCGNPSDVECHYYGAYFCSEECYDSFSAAQHFICI